MNILVCICSRYPNPTLYDCIRNVYDNQIKHSSDIYTVHVVDSDSTSTEYYDKVREDFPEVHIHMVKNKNYEYGAWKYISDTYPKADIYFCIQDSILVHNYVDVSMLGDKFVYTFNHDFGYFSHMTVKEDGIKMLKDSGLNYESYIDTDFMIAQHSSFIVTNTILNDIFTHLKIPPINKDGSCIYERNFGIYFLDKGITTLNLYNYMSKIHNNRL
jgi:hypothetical protein